MVINSKDKIVELGSSAPLLIMLPFAGGNSYSYDEMIKYLQYDYQILCPELPGRGEYSDEPLIKDLKQLTESIFLNWIKPAKLQRRYVIFGHSMGALMGYLLVHRLIKAKLPLPMHFIASGREGPMYIDNEEPVYSLPSSEFRSKIMEYGGASKEVLDDPELIAYFEPIFRADFEAVETYYPAPSDPLEIPITVFHGSEEDIPDEALMLWKDASQKEVNIIKLPGNHFFIRTNAKRIASYLISLIKH